MRPSFVRQLIYSQLFLMAGLLICVMIKPHGLVANAGISYFGIFKITILPYACGLIGAAACVFRAANSLPSSYKNLKIPMILYSIGTIGIVLTPYSYGSLIDWTHTIIGCILFGSQFILISWLTMKSRQSKFILLYALELLAGYFCLIYAPPPKGYLIEAQVAFQLIFIFYIREYFENYNSDKVFQTESSA